MRLDDLDAQEKLALGGLIRLMIRSDGSFTETEEATVNAIGERLASRDAIWSVVSASAQAWPDDAAIRVAAGNVARAEARRVIFGLIGEIADDGEVTQSERELLDWLKQAWGL